MGKNHLKSLKAPKTWNIKRKERIFITRPLPGQSSFYLGMPLNIVIRDIFKLAKSNREVRSLINNGEISVNNKIIKEPKSIIGFMDTISIPKLKKNYRILLNQKGNLSFIEIPDSEKDKKICKIIGKTIYKKKTQLNLYDGRNLLLDKDIFKVGDSVLISLPNIKILDHLKSEKNALIILIGGSHIGQIGTIESSDANKIMYKRSTGEVFETQKKYAFVIGKQKPALKLDSEQKTK